MSESESEYEYECERELLIVVTSEVRLEHSFRSEAGIAPRISTLKWQFSLEITKGNQKYRMTEHVLFQLCACSEGFGAILISALVWFFIIVNPIMAFQRRVGCKRFLTYTTLEHLTMSECVR